MKGNRFLEYKTPGFDKEKAKKSCNCKCECANESKIDLIPLAKSRPKYLGGTWCEIDSYGTYVDKDEPKKEKEENGK